ncbi:MAG: hypothetical protein ACJARD_000511 [Alphaproteobacteria bacterium]|jgi:hypothetical protein
MEYPMSQPAPWSIKGVDKETREKMKKMAHNQGMTLADFLDNLMKSSTQHITNSINDIGEESQILSNDQPELGNAQSVTISEPKQEPEAQIEAPTAPPLLLSAPSKSEILPIIKEKEAEKPKRSYNLKPKTSVKMAIKATPAKTSPRKNKAKANPLSFSTNNTQKTPQPQSGIFQQLTQKIGIETPSITELSDNSLTDTITRERHLRDMMRVQMTEMRDIFGTIIETKIDEKFREFIPSLQEKIAASITEISFDGENILKKQDLQHALIHFSDSIQNHFLHMIKQEFSVLSENTENYFDQIIKDMRHINETILGHIENTKVMNLHHIADDFSGGDIAAFSALQDSADVLSGRIGRIEEVCLMLDDKLSHLQIPHYAEESNGAQSSEYINNMRAVKDELEGYVKSIPSYLDKIVSTSKSEDNSKIVTTLHSVSNRLLQLESLVQNLSQPKKQPIDEPHNQYTQPDPDPYNSPPEMDHDNVNNINEIMSDDWEDDDAEEDEAIMGGNFLEEIHDDHHGDDSDDIRNIDKQTLLKNARLNVENQINNRSKKISKDVFNTKNILIAAGGAGILIVAAGVFLL